jgi:DNA repair protein RecO (recombination protein O)
MPAEEVTAAIVLRTRDYSESDRIVTLLTEDTGKIGGIAKGAKSSRRRFERKLEPFSHVMLYFRRRPHGQLVFITRAEAAGLTQFHLDGDLGRFALGSYMLELADALASEEADAAGAYRLLADSLETLSLGTASAAMRQAYELRILGWAGFGLDFERCRICGADQADAPASYFIVGGGGVVCSRCRESTPEGGIRIAAPSAAALANLARIPIDTACNAQAAGPDGALAVARFISSVIDRKLRSVEFLDSIIAPPSREAPR